MIRALRLSQVVVCATVAFSALNADAGGWFGSKKCETCEACQTCPECAKKKKNCSLFDLADPPRAGTANAVPAVMTNQRADRQPAKAAAAAPAIPPAAAPANGCTATNTGVANDPRVDNLQKDIATLKEQMRVLTSLLEQSAK